MRFTRQCTQHGSSNKATRVFFFTLCSTNTLAPFESIPSRSQRVYLIVCNPIDLFRWHEDVAVNLPSGTTPEDALKELERGMWVQSVKAKEEATKAQKAAEFDEWNDRSGGAEGAGGGEASRDATNSVLPTPAADVALATTEPRRFNSAAESSGEAGDSLASLTRMAAAAHLRELVEAGSRVGSGAARDDPFA